MRRELNAQRARLGRLKDVTAAKRYLMQAGYLSEDEAHHLLQRLSMNSRRPLYEVALEVLAQARTGDPVESRQAG